MTENFKLNTEEMEEIIFIVYNDCDGWHCLPLWQLDVKLQINRLLLTDL